MDKRILVVFIPILLTLYSFGQPASDSIYPPPGRMVDIGGRKLHLLCSGKGSPTIVLVAGGGAFSIDWNLVQTRVDSTTRVCAYDRAGLGWSDSSHAEETVEEVVSDLHKLLKAAGEKGPYLLVGASIAGIYIQAYQHKYPKEVAGLVFTNSSNRIGFVGKNKGGLIWDLTEDDIRPTFPIPPSNKKFTPATKVAEPFNRLPSQLQQMRLQLSNHLYLKWNTATGTPDGLLSWRKEFLREFNESDKFKGRFPLGNLPVIVVASDSMAHDSLRYSRTGAAARLDYLSSNSVHIIASGSGHEIHLYQPDAVVDALRLAVIAVRKKVPLSEVSELQ